MPRSKLTTNQYSLLYSKIGYFKTEYPDFIYDFSLIYKSLLEIYLGTEFEKLSFFSNTKEKMISLQKTHFKPHFDNRFYIVTAYDSPVLAVVNMDEPVIDNIIDTYNTLSFINDDCPERIPGSYFCTLFVFKGNEMVLKSFISPYKMAHFMAAFKNENLINYQGVRDSLYAAPRRRFKRNQSRA